MDEKKIDLKRNIKIEKDRCGIRLLYKGVVFQRLFRIISHNLWLENRIFDFQCYFSKIKS